MKYASKTKTSKDVYKNTHKYTPYVTPLRQIENNTKTTCNKTPKTAPKPLPLTSNHKRVTAAHPPPSQTPPCNNSFTSYNGWMFADHEKTPPPKKTPPPNVTSSPSNKSSSSHCRFLCRPILYFKLFFKFCIFLSYIIYTNPLPFPHQILLLHSSPTAPSLHKKSTHSHRK